MDYSKSVLNRIKRAEGQLKGILRMMEDGQSCERVVTQLSAVQGALDRAVGIVVSENLEQCIRRSLENNEATEDLVEEAVKLLVKSR